MEVVQAELVGENEPGPAAAPEPRYVITQHTITQHTVLAPGELPPLADQKPAWTDDFRLSEEDVADLAGPDLAENTIINRDSTIRAFVAWCATATYTSYGSYGLRLIHRGRAGEFKPDTVGQYMSRIWNRHPIGLRPDRSRFQARLRAWKKE